MSSAAVTRSRSKRCDTTVRGAAVVARPVANQKANGRGLHRLPCVSHGTHWVPGHGRARPPCTRHRRLVRAAGRRSGSAPGAERARAPTRSGIPSWTTTNCSRRISGTVPYERRRRCAAPGCTHARTHTHTHAQERRTHAQTHTHDRRRCRRIERPLLTFVCYSPVSSAIITTYRGRRRRPRRRRIIIYNIVQLIHILLYNDIYRRPCCTVVVFYDKRAKRPTNK